MKDAARTLFFVFLGAVFAAGVGSFGYGALMLVEVFRTGEGEGGAIARQVYGVLGFSGAIAYGIKRGPAAIRDGRPSSQSTGSATDQQRRR
jgi:uncharacterized membrane protein YuzA (DUF378 family)